MLVMLRPIIQRMAENLGRHLKGRRGEMTITDFG